MPRPTGKVPVYSLHRASGCPVVRLQGRDHYLGRYGSPESHELYQRKIAEWRTSQISPPPERTPTTAGELSLTIAEVLDRYRNFARGYYVKNGRTTKEFVSLKYALRPVRLLYGSTLAKHFGPLALKAVRQQMIDSDHCRNVINNNVNPR